MRDFTGKEQGFNAIMNRRLGPEAARNFDRRQREGSLRTTLLAVPFWTLGIAAKIQRASQ